MDEAATRHIPAVKGAGTKIKVWDPLVRIFHWSLAGLFFFAYFSGEEWQKWHQRAGYTIGLLIAIRLVWGFIGSEHARFGSFLYGPRTVLTFLRDSLAFRARRYIGHNPAGGAMVVLLLAMIAGIVTTGYMMTTDTWWGIAWVEDSHKALVYTTLGLIALHVAGVLLASIEHRENLVRSMVTGWKQRD